MPEEYDVGHAVEKNLFVAAALHRKVRWEVNDIIEFWVRGVFLSLLSAGMLLLCRRTAAAYRHRICLAALCGLLALPLFQRLLPSLPLLPSPSAPAPRQSPIGNPIALPTPPNTATTHQPTYTLSNRPQAALTAQPSLPTSMSRAALEHSAQAPTPHPFRATSGALLAVWGTGCGVLLIRLTIALLRLRKLKTDSQPAMLEEVPIRVSTQIETPITWGVRRPTILVPATLLSADPALCETALRHEQAHIARRDWIWNLLAETICALCWFQPGVWWLYRRMRIESERACDDLVLLSGIDGPDYAAHLLQILRSTRTHEIAPAMAQSGKMEDRMRYILDTKQPRRSRPLRLALATSVGFALLSLTALRLSAREAAAHLPSEKIPASPSTTKSTFSPQPSRFPLTAPELSTPSEAGLPSAELPHVGEDPAVRRAPATVAPPLSRSAALQAPPAATAVPSAPDLSLKNVVWGKAQDGLEPGFLVTGPDMRQFPLNTQLNYRVLVRNSSRRERVVEVKCENFTDLSPGLVPDAEIHHVLNSSKIPDAYRAIDVYEEVEFYPSYTVKLAPGEAVVLPETLHLYLGDADKQHYPRFETVPSGRSWIVHPIAVRALTAEEAQEDLGAIQSLSGNGIDLTIRKRDGSVGTTRGARYPIRTGARMLFATLPHEFGTEHAANAPAEKPIQWGEVSNGFQLGARLAQESKVFKVGEVIKFQPFGRNLSGHDVNLSVGNYWKVNYRIQIQTLDGKPVYMERDAHNQAMEVAGYRMESLGNGVTWEISQAILKIAPQGKPAPIEVATAEPGHYIINQDEAWVESVALKPGRYRVRLVSWHLFGDLKQEPMSGWIPIEVQQN